MYPCCLLLFAKKSLLVSKFLLFSFVQQEFSSTCFAVTITLALNTHLSALSYTYYFFCAPQPHHLSGAPLCGCALFQCFLTSRFFAFSKFTSAWRDTLGTKVNNLQFLTLAPWFMEIVNFSCQPLRLWEMRSFVLLILP